MPAITQADLDNFLAGPGDVELTLTRLEAWQVYQSLRSTIRHRYGPTGSNGVGAVAHRLEDLIREPQGAPA